MAALKEPTTTTPLGCRPEPGLYATASAKSSPADAMRTLQSTSPVPLASFVRNPSRSPATVGALDPTTYLCGMENTHAETEMRCKREKSEHEGVGACQAARQGLDTHSAALPPSATSGSTPPPGPQAMSRATS